MTSIFAATLPTSPAAVQAATQRAGLGLVGASAANLGPSNNTTPCSAERKQQLPYIPCSYSCRAGDTSTNHSKRSTKTFSVHKRFLFIFTLDMKRRRRKKITNTMKGDDMHLHCCFVSKVRRQLGILQLRRGNSTGCYWQRTDV